MKHRKVTDHVYLVRNMFRQREEEGEAAEGRSRLLTSDYNMTVQSTVLMSISWTFCPRIHNEAKCPEGAHFGPYIAGSLRKHRVCNIISY